MKLQTNEQEELYKQFPFIVKWGRMMGSYDYYIVNQCREAKEDGAPSNAIHKDHGTGKWSTTDDVKNPEVRHHLGI